MQRFSKTIKNSIKQKMELGSSPQTMYDETMSQYVTDCDVVFLKRFIAKTIRNSVLPETRKKYRFYHLAYLVSLILVFVVTILVKQDRIEQLGINAIFSLTAISSFLLFNIFAWIYLYLIICSLRFNLSAISKAMFVAIFDIIRLSLLLPIHSIEQPVSALIRIIPLFLTLLFGIICLKNCSNKFQEDKKNHIIKFV